MIESKVKPTHLQTIERLLNYLRQRQRTLNSAFKISYKKVLRKNHSSRVSFDILSLKVTPFILDRLLFLSSLSSTKKTSLKDKKASSCSQLIPEKTISALTQSQTRSCLKQQ